MDIKQKILQLIGFIRISYQQFTTSHKFRIEEIDLNSKTVIIHRRGSHAIFKLSISEVICDVEIISNLPSDQACWLGYYCGKMHSEPLLEKNYNFSMRFTQGGFKISSQDRKGNILYIDTKTQELFTASPLDICENNFIIKQFDPSQACFIGILAGKVAEKSSTRMNVHKFKKPHLTLIK